MAQNAEGAATAAGESTGRSPKSCQITILYDGRDKKLDVNMNAAVNALLEHAMNEFGITSNRHTIGLWTEGGVELSLTGSLEDQGVKCGETLLLRPSAVRGGRW